MTTIREILMTRDGMTADEADNLINEARGQLFDYLADGDMAGAEEICSEFFGLEPDYLFELM
jgi:hypothetical protein